MDVYNNETNRNEKNYQDGIRRSFFPRSVMNDWLPLSEKIIFFILGFIGLSVLATAISMLLMGPLMAAEEAGDETQYYLLESFVEFGAYLLGVLILVLILVFDKRKTYLRLILQFKDWRPFAFGALACLAILVFEDSLSIIYSNVFPEIYGVNNNQSTIVDLFAVNPVCMTICIVFFAPLVEEFTYRIGLVDTIGHKHRWLGIIFSGIIFGFVHFSFSSITDYLSAISYYNAGAIEYSVLQNYLYIMLNEILNLPIYIGAGCIMAFTYAKSGKISTSICAHMFNNLISVISILITLRA